MDPNAKLAAVPTVTDLWIYRAGYVSVDQNHRRAFWGATWSSSMPPFSDARTASTLVSLANYSLNAPTGPNPWTDFHARHFGQEVFPRRRQFLPLIFSPIVGGTPLNPNAPEAAFRLQRVGARSGVYGRICWPIKDDSYFSDLPHRRHILNSIVTPTKLPTQFGGTPHKFTELGGREYYECIWNRQTYTAVNVVGLRLLPNPVRIWERMRTYADHGYTTPDTAYAPNEGTYP